MWANRASRRVVFQRADAAMDPLVMKMEMPTSLSQLLALSVT